MLLLRLQFSPHLVVSVLSRSKILIGGYTFAVVSISLLVYLREKSRKQHTKKITCKIYCLRRLHLMEWNCEWFKLQLVSIKQNSFETTWWRCSDPNFDIGADRHECLRNLCLHHYPDFCLSYQNEGFLSKLRHLVNLVATSWNFTTSHAEIYFSILPFLKPTMCFVNAVMSANAFVLMRVHTDGPISYLRGSVIKHYMIKKKSSDRKYHLCEYKYFSQPKQRWPFFSLQEVNKVVLQKEHLMTREKLVRMLSNFSSGSQMLYLLYSLSSEYLCKNVESKNMQSWIQAELRISCSFERTLDEDSAYINLTTRRSKALL